MNPDFERLIRTRVLAGRAVWVMITGSVVFYFFLAYKIAGVSAGAGRGGLSDAEPLFYIAAAAAAVFSAVYRLRSFSDDGVRAILSKFDAGSHGIEDVSALSESEKRAFFLLNELQKASVINLIINEIVIMTGFALSFLSGDFVKIIPFGVASLLLCLWMFPKTESLIKKAQNIFPR